MSLSKPVDFAAENPESTFVMVEEQSHGRKTNEEMEPALVSSDELSSEELVEDSSDEEYDSDDDEDEEEDEEIEEFFEERALIRKEIAELKKLAGFYLHPEKPVEVDGTATASCVFDRMSMEDTVYEAEEAVERAKVLAEAKALKESAMTYRHPEAPLQVDATACARNYFHRYSAEEAVDFDEAQERAAVLADAAAMKKLAMDWRHSEKPVETTDATVFGRNFFSRPSAPTQETEEQDMERDDVLEDMAELKRLAVMYRHPEKKIETTDATIFGRNYFSRPSAPDAEEEEERAQILAEAAMLKKQAQDYLHPERPVVTTDPFACGRNFFTRASAPEYEDEDDDEERELVLAEAKALKDLATMYAHPEVSVTTTDPAACARCYFDRASAPQVDQDEENERDQILAEMASLKKLAADYMHPERPVEVDGTACARCYFDRASAPEQVDEDDEDEKDLILEEMAALKRLAMDYKHPERPVEVDGTAMARNFFTRASAPQPESVEEAEERAQVLADAKALKDSAVTWKHPEKPVVSDGTAMARNFFSRPSAPEQVSLEEAEEQARIMEDAKALKKLAVAYMHPEAPLVSDAAVCGRNYFNRYSAPGVAENVHSMPADGHATQVEAEEHSHHDDYGHFEMDEDAMYADMRVSLVAALPGDTIAKPAIISDKITSEEEGELSRSPSSVMLFSGVDPEANDLRLPSMS